jgi:hypothetical protein
VGSVARVPPLNVRGAAPTAPPEMFHTSLPSLPKDASRNPRDTDDDVAHQLPRHEGLLSPQVNRWSKDLAHPVKTRPGTGSRPAPAGRQTLTSFL